MPCMRDKEIMDVRSNMIDVQYRIEESLVTEIEKAAVHVLRRVRLARPRQSCNWRKSSSAGSCNLYFANPKSIRSSSNF